MASNYNIHSVNFLSDLFVESESSMADSYDDVHTRVVGLYLRDCCTYWAYYIIENEGTSVSWNQKTEFVTNICAYAAFFEEFMHHASGNVNDRSDYQELVANDKFPHKIIQNIDH